MNLFDKAVEQNIIYYVNSSFKELCEIFTNPIDVDMNFVPVKYTTLSKEEYARFRKECVYPWSMDKDITGIVIFQDKDDVARFGLWNVEKDK